MIYSWIHVIIMLIVTSAIIYSLWEGTIFIWKKEKEVKK